MKSVSRRPQSGALGRAWWELGESNLQISEGREEVCCHATLARHPRPGGDASWPQDLGPDPGRGQRGHRLLQVRPLQLAELDPGGWPQNRPGWILTRRRPSESRRPCSSLVLQVQPASILLDERIAQAGLARVPLLKDPINKIRCFLAKMIKL